MPVLLEGRSSKSGALLDAELQLTSRTPASPRRKACALTLTIDTVEMIASTCSTHAVRLFPRRIRMTSHSLQSLRRLGALIVLVAGCAHCRAPAQRSDRRT